MKVSLARIYVQLQLNLMFLFINITDYTYNLIIFIPHITFSLACLITFIKIHIPFNIHIVLL